MHSPPLVVWHTRHATHPLLNKFVPCPSSAVAGSGSLLLVCHWRPCVGHKPKVIGTALQQLVVGAQLITGSPQHLYGEGSAGADMPCPCLGTLPQLGPFERLTTPALQMLPCPDSSCMATT